MFEHHDANGMIVSCGDIQQAVESLPGMLVDVEDELKQLRAENTQLRTERDRLLMKYEKDRIIPPMRLDELEAACQTAREEADRG